MTDRYLPTYTPSEPGMSSTIIAFDSEAVQPVTSTGGGVYATRKGRKSVDTGKSVQDHKIIDEENGSVIEKDVLDERDVRKRQVRTLNNILLATRQLTVHQVVRKMANIMVSYDISLLQLIIVF